MGSREWVVLTSAGCLLWFAVCGAFGCFFITVVLVFNSVAVYICICWLFLVFGLLRVVSL